MLLGFWASFDTRERERGGIYFGWSSKYRNHVLRSRMPRLFSVPCMFDVVVRNGTNLSSTTIKPANDPWLLLRALAVLARLCREVLLAIYGNHHTGKLRIPVYMHVSLGTVPAIQHTTRRRTVGIVHRYAMYLDSTDISARRS
jgi:hypothetical protein